MRLVFRFVVNLFCIYALAFYPAIAAAQSISIDGTAVAGQRPAITNSGGGKPQINIAPPSNGVSVNRYSSFSTSSGAIFNNSASAGTSRSGGSVGANTRLSAGAEAKVILNDVRGTERSTLGGTFEVFGPKADLVITNQNGITCNGCNFINASRTVLATGAASVNANGDVVLDTRKGNVHVGRSGVTADGTLALVGRTVTVDGPVQATVVDAIGGASTYNARSREVGAGTPEGAAGSTYAVDATAFGAMTAGQIRIIGNENGLGVRTDGALTATAGDVALHSKANVNHSTVTASRDFVVRGGAGHVQQDRGTVTAGRNVDIVASTYAQAASASMEASGNVKIDAADTILIAGEVVSATATYDAVNKLLNVGEIVASGTVTVVAGEVWNMRSDRNVELTFAEGGIDRSCVIFCFDLGSYMVMTNSASWADRGYMIGHGGVIAAQNLTLTANKTDLNNSGVLVAAQALVMSATRNVTQQSLRATYRTTASGNYLATDLTKAKSATLAAQIAALAGGSVRDIYNGTRDPLISGSLVYYGTKAHGIGSLTVTGGHSVQNLGGEMKSNGTLRLQADLYDVNLRAYGRWSHNFSYGGDTEVIAQRNINLTSADLRAESGTLKLQAQGGFNHDQESIDAARYRNLYVREMGDALNNPFTIDTTGWVDLASRGTLTGTTAITASAITLQSTTGEVNQSGITRSTGQTKFVSAGNMRVTNSESSGGTLVLQSTAGNIYIQGNARGVGLDIDAEYSLVNGTSTMYAGAGGINILAGASITNEGGRIWSHGTIDLLAGRKYGGDIISSHGTAARGAGYIRTYGTSKNLRLDTDRGTIRLTNNAAIASGNVTLNARDAIWIQRSHVEGNTVSLTAQNTYTVNETDSLVKANLNDVIVLGGRPLYNRSGATIEALRDVTVTANAMYNHGQSVAAGRNILLTLGNRLENYNDGSRRALLSAGGAITIASAVGDVYNRASDIWAGGDVSIDSGLDRVQFWDAASLTTGGALTITAGESGDYADGIHITGTPLTATRMTLNTTGRVVLYPGSDLTTTAGDLVIDAGRRLYQYDSDFTSAAQLLVASDGVTFTGSHSQSVNYMKYDSQGSVEIYDGYSRNPLLKSTTGSVDVYSRDSHIDTRNATIDGYRYVMLNARNNMAIQTNTTVRARTLNATLKAGVGGHIYYRYGSNVSAGQDVILDSRNHVYLHGRTLTAGRDIIANLAGQFELYNDGASRGTLQAGRNITVNSTGGRILTSGADMVATAGNIAIGSDTSSVEFWGGATVTTAGSFSAQAGNWSGRGVWLNGMPVTATSILLASGTGWIVLEPGSDLVATTGDITITSDGRYYQRDSDVTAKGAVSVTSNGVDFVGSAMTAQGGAITMASGANVSINDGYARNPSLWASGAITVSSANDYIVNNGTINGGGTVTLTSKNNLHNDTSAIIKSRTGSVSVRSLYGHVYNRYNSTIEAKLGATVRAGVHLFNHGASMKALGGNLTLIAGGAIENHQWSTTRGLLSATGNLSATAGTTHFWTNSSDMVAGGDMSAGSTGSHMLAENGATFTQGGSFTGFSGSYDGYGLRLFGVPITATAITLGSTSGYVQLEPAALTATAGNITIDSAGRFYQRDSAMTASGAISIAANGYENDGSWTTANGGAITVTSDGSIDITDAYSRNPRLWASGAITLSSANSHFVNNGEINGGGDVRITARNNLHNDSGALTRSRAGSVFVTSTYGNIYNRYASSLHAKKSVVANAVRGGIYNHGGTIHGIDTDVTLTAAYAIENHQWSTTRGLIKAGGNLSAEAGLSHLWSIASDWQAGGNMTVGSTDRQVEVTTGSTFTQGGSFTAFSSNWSGQGIRLYGTPITATSISLGSTSGYILLEPANLTATAGNITINAAGRYYQRNTDLVASAGVSITSNGVDVVGSAITAQGGAITMASGANVSINDGYSRNPSLWASGAITVSSANDYVVNNGSINGGGAVSLTARNNLHNDINALIRSRSGSVTLQSITGSVHNRYSSRVESQGNTTFAGINIYNDGSTVTAGGKIEMAASNYLHVIEHGAVRSVLTSGAGQALNLRAGTSNLLVRNSDVTSGGTLYIGSAQSSLHNQTSVISAAASALLESKGEFRATGGSLTANGVTIDSQHHLYLLDGHRLTARNGANDVTMTAFYDYLERDSFVTAGRNVTLTDARNVYFYDSDTWAKTGSVDVTARGELKHRIDDTDESNMTAGLDVSLIAAGYLENYRASITAGRSAVLRSTGGTLSNNSASVTSGADMTLQAAHDLYLSRGLATRETLLTAAGSMTVTAGNTLYADAGLVDAGGWLKFNSRLTPRFGAQVHDNAQFLHLGVNVAEGSFTSYFGADTTGAIDIYARDGVTLTKAMRGDNWVRVRSGAGAISAGYLLRSDNNWLQVTGGGNITLGNAQAAGNVTIESTAGSVINTYNISSNQTLSVKAHKDIIAQASVATRRGAFMGAGSVSMNAGRSMTLTNALVSSNGQIDLYAGQKELGTLSVTTTLADLKSGVENRLTAGAAINMIVNYGGDITLTGAEIYGLGRVNTFAGAGGGGTYTTRAATIGTVKVGTLLRGQDVIQNATTLTLADTEIVGLSSVAQYAQLTGGITMDRGRIQTHTLRIEALGNTEAKAIYRDLTDITVGGTLSIDVASAASLKAGTIRAGLFDLINTPDVTLIGNIRNHANNNLSITAKNGLTLAGTSHRGAIALTSLSGVLANTGTLRADQDIRLIANRTVTGVTLRNDGLLWAARDVFLTADRGIDPGRVQATNLTVRSENGSIGATGAMMATATIDLFANDITTRSVLARNVVIDARRGSFTVNGWQVTDGDAFQTGLGEFTSRMGDIVGTVSEVVDGETQQVTQAQFEADLLTSGNAMFHVESDLTIETRDNINVLAGGILSARGDMTLTAGKGVLVQSAFGESVPDIVVTATGSAISITTQVKKFWHRRASIVADGDLTITALGNGLTLTDAGVAAIVAARDTARAGETGFTYAAGTGVIYNQGSISAGGNLILNAALDLVNKSTRVTYTLTAEHNCGYNACGSDAYMFAPGEIIAGQGLIMTAGVDILNDASQVAAAGSIYATAGNDIFNNIQTAHYLSYYYKKTKRGWFGIKTGETIDKRYSAAMQSGVFQTSFGDIDLIAGRDIDSSGSYVSSGANARLVAARDVYMDAVSVELDNYYKNSGFSGFLTYSSTKTRYNNFETSMAQVEGFDVSIDAGRNVTGIGVILLAMNDLSIVSGAPYVEDDGKVNGIVFDALTNRKYLEESGWSFGLTSSRFTITQSVLNNANNDPIHQYIADNPMLGAAYQLATAKDGWGRLNGSLALLVSGARALSTARDEEVGTNLFGSKLAESFIPNDIKAIQAIGQCGGNDVTRCVMEAAGIGFRFDAWHSRSEWDESLVSRLGAGRDMFLLADRDIQLAGGSIVNTGRDLVITAGRDFIATALANTQENSSRSFGFGVSLFNNGTASGFTLSVDASGSSSNSLLYTNASINAMNSITLVTGRDAMLLGAVMQARPVTGIREDAAGNPILDANGNYIEILGNTGGDIYMNIGRDLVVASRQSTSASNSWGFGLSLTFTGGTLSGVGINVNIADGKARYVATPSMIDAYRILDIYVDEKTYLMGAVLVSRDAKLALDTGYLIHENLFNERNNYAVNVGLDIGVGQIHSFDGTAGFSMSVTEGFTRATISGGEVRVRNQRNFDISQINQNMNAVDTITRSTHVNLQLPALNLVKLARDIEAAGNYIRAATADVPDEIRNKGEHAVDLFRQAIASGMSRDQLAGYLSSEGFQIQLDRRRSWQELADNPVTNPEELARLTYLIATGEQVYYDEASQRYMIQRECSSGDETVCGRPVEELGNLTQPEVQNFVNQAIQAILSGRGGWGEAQQKFSDAFRCAMAWGLVGGEGAVQIAASLYNTQGVRQAGARAEERVLLLTIMQYRSVQATGVLSMDTLPPEFMSALISNTLAEIRYLQANEGRFVPRSLEHDYQTLYGNLFGYGYSVAEIRDIAGTNRNSWSYSVFWDYSVIDLGRLEHPGLDATMTAAEWAQVIAEIGMMNPRSLLAVFRHNAARLLTRGLDDALGRLINRRSSDTFYNPQAWRQNYENFYGSANVSSTTVPPYSAPNVRLAGQRHPGTGIVFDNRGFPIFDDVAAYDTRLPVDAFRAMSYRGQMRAATRDLRTQIENGTIPRSRFTQAQLDAIYGGQQNIPGYTWHHHQDTGRMQLVPYQVHRNTGHIGWEGLQ